MMAQAEHAARKQSCAAVIALHGRSQPPEFMQQVLARIGRPVLRWVLPRAPGDSWYPEKFMAPRDQNQPWLDAALATVDDAVRGLERAGLARSRIVLLGFSQGACLASEYLYRNPGSWGGLVALTGGLVGPEGSEWPTPAQALAGTSVLMTNGDTDPWVPLERTRASADVLRAMGASVDERVYGGRAHEIVEDEIVAVRAILDGSGKSRQIS